MAIDPLASGVTSQAHVSLIEAGAIARGMRPGGTPLSSATKPPSAAAAPSASRKGTTPRAAARQTASRRISSSRAFDPHTPIQSNVATDPDQYDGLLNRMGQKYNVPPLFLKAVMLSESGGRPDAIGDSGHSVGLFQLHDQGYGAGMGDSRFDPETNADRAAKGLAEAWRAGERAGYSGEFAVRSAYNYSFNPGGGFAYQGDSVVKHYNELLGEQGFPPLS
jgi:soluble lytic murein transglycosylase-like protein